MKFSLTLFLIFVVSSLFAQSDYEILNERYHAQYGELSYDNLEQRISFLDSISKIDLSSGRETFLMDLGTAYGWRQVQSMEDSDQMKSLEAFKQCWEEFENQDALFQVMSIYMFVDCTMSLLYANAMEEIIDNGKLVKSEKKESYQDQIGRIRQFCSM